MHGHSGAQVQAGGLWSHGGKKKKNKGEVDKFIVVTSGVTLRKLRLFRAVLIEPFPGSKKNALAAPIETREIPHEHETTVNYWRYLDEE